MSGFLKEMALSSIERLAHARQCESENTLWRRVIDLPPPPQLKLSPQGFDVIAELKLRSPAAGVLGNASKSIGERVCAYAKSGAAAVSVLTEPRRFDGSMAHLARASAALEPLDVPVMRKDFIIEPYQIMEARDLGAGGVLVILRMMDRGRIAELLDCAAMLKMFVLLEGFNEADMELAARLLEERKGKVEKILVGVNSRDLDTLRVVPDRLEAMASKLPPGFPHVGESGVTTAEDAGRMARAGYQMVLVGGALMLEDDPSALLKSMLDAGRAAKQTR